MFYFCYYSRTNSCSDLKCRLIKKGFKTVLHNMYCVYNQLLMPIGNQQLNTVTLNCADGPQNGGWIGRQTHSGLRCPGTQQQSLHSSRLNSCGTILQIPKTYSLYIRNSLHADYQAIRQQRACEPLQEISDTTYNKL